MKYKTGIGYDIHQLIKGRKLFLGGIEVPFEMGLDGHSDADVALHAICDALLGAVAKGDIGEHFPDSDDDYKDISSLVLLEKVNEIIKKEGFDIGNIDILILAEKPKLTKYKEQMRKTIAGVLNINNENVNVKATTSEGLGSIGQKQAIAAFATVLLEQE